MKNTITLTISLFFAVITLYSQVQQGTGSLLARKGSFPVDTTLIYGSAAHSQWEQDVAFDGENYLIVWTDYRNGSETDIYGARISASGELLDPTGFLISGAPEYQNEAKVAFDGTNFLVVWSDERNYLTDQSEDIYGARVTTSGEVLDPEGFLIYSNEESQRHPDVAFDGTNYLVVWDDAYMNIAEQDLMFTRVSPSGQVLDPGGIYLTNNAYTQNDPCIEFNGQHYLVAWGDGRDGIYAGRILPNGTVLDLNGFPVNTGDYNYRKSKITTNGSGFFVVWNDDRNTSYAYDIFGSRIDANGNVLDVNGIPIAVSGQSLVSPGVAFDGSNYLVSYAGGEGTYFSTFDLYAKRVSVDGMVIDQDPLVVCNETEEQNDPIVAFGSENCIITWKDERAGTSNQDIFFGRMEPSGNLLDPSGKLASRGANLQIHSDAAFDGSNFLVVWNEYRNNGSYDIYGIRISPEGQNIEQNAFPIMTGAGFYSSPSIAFNGNYYLVVWTLLSDIYCKRISPAGVVLDSDPIEIFVGPYSQTNPWVTTNQDQWLVVWDDGRGNKNDIYCTRVSNSGNVLDPGGILVCDADNYQRNPRAVFNGSEYFVVWQDNRGGTFADYEIYGSRISPDGNVLDPGGIAISTGTEGDKLLPDLAFDGTNYMVVWHEGLSPREYDIKARRVSADGTVPGNSDINIEIAGNEQSMPRVAFDGQDFITVWQDRSNNSYYTIKGARITNTGDVEEIFNVSDGSHERTFPSIIAASVSKVFCTYSAFEEILNDMPVNTNRIIGILFTDDISGLDGQTGNFEVDVQIYPNPITDKMHITCSDLKTEDGILEILSMDGKELLKREIEQGNENLEIDMGNLKTGIYICKLSIGNRFSINKIIKV